MRRQIRLGLVCAVLVLGVLYLAAPSRSSPAAPPDVWPASLGERAADSGVRPDLPPPPSASPQEGTEGRHCWVRDPPDAPGT